MRTLRWLWLLALALSVSSCIKVDQTLTLEDDGSGTLDIRYGMSEQTISQLETMEQMGQAMGDNAGTDLGMDTETPFDFDFDEEDVRERFESEPIKGVELVSTNAETIDGWRYMNLKVRFDSLAALAKTDLFEDSEISLTRDAEGHYVLRQRSGDAEPMPSDDSAEDPMQTQMMQQMAAMFAGMRIANRVSVPTEIIETNATEVEGRTASWVFDIDEDPTVLSKLEHLDMRVVFSSTGASIDEL